MRARLTKETRHGRTTEWPMTLRSCSAFSTTSTTRRPTSATRRGASRSRTIAREARFAAERDDPAPLSGRVLSFGRPALAGLLRGARRGRRSARRRARQPTGSRARFPQRLPPSRHAGRQRRRAARRRSSAATTAGPTASTGGCGTCRTSTAFPASTRARAGSCRSRPSSATASSSSRRDAPRLAGRTPRRASAAASRAELSASSAATDNDVPANWKIVVEGFLEGYHIRSTHAETFYPGSVRQPERRRDVRPQQPRRLPVPQHQQAAHRAARGALRRRQAHLRLPPVPQRHGGDLPRPHLHGRARAARDRSHALRHLRAEQSAARRRRGADATEARRRPRRRRRVPRTARSPAPSSAAWRAARTSSRVRLFEAASSISIRDGRRWPQIERPGETGPELSMHATRPIEKASIWFLRHLRPSAAICGTTPLAPTAPPPSRRNPGRTPRRHRPTAERERGSYRRRASCSRKAATRRHRCRRSPIGSASRPARCIGTFPPRPSSSSSVPRRREARSHARSTRRRPPADASNGSRPPWPRTPDGALRHRRLAWALLYEPVDPLVDAERLVYRRTYCRHMAGLLRQAIAAGEIPEQNVELSAAAVVGAIAESLVGPLSPVGGQITADEDIVAWLVRFCRRSVGAPDNATLRRIAPTPIGT